MDALLVNGELDFALIDTFTVDPLIITQPIWDETSPFVVKNNI